jgi:hypothetical protein
MDNHSPQLNAEEQFFRHASHQEPKAAGVPLNPMKWVFKMDWKPERHRAGG